jgi:hypothetical protein
MTPGVIDTRGACRWAGVFARAGAAVVAGTTATTAATATATSATTQAVSPAVHALRIAALGLQGVHVLVIEPNPATTVTQ